MEVSNRSSGVLETPPSQRQALRYSEPNPSIEPVDPKPGALLKSTYMKSACNILKSRHRAGPSCTRAGAERAHLRRSSVPGRLLFPINGFAMAQNACKRPWVPGADVVQV